MISAPVQAFSEKRVAQANGPRRFDARNTLHPSHNSTLDTLGSSFVGREEEVRTLQALLEQEDVRLVTLTGPGGVGKTRLALRVASEIDRASLTPGGVARGSEQNAASNTVQVIYLAQLGDPRFVMPQIAQALGVREFQNLPALEALKYHLAGRSFLLVLDNFEHVIDAAPLVADLLKSAPWLKVLATSREALHLYGEREVAVLPLSVPADGEGAHGENAETTLGQYSAVRLFLDRARAVKHDFIPSPTQMEEIAEICRRLDGLPLAIELAAARIRTLTTKAILAQMGSLLSLLVGGARDWPERHRTIRAAIGWSYEFLDKDERLMLCRLAVFAGTWTEEAARAVCAGQIDYPALGPATPADDSKQRGDMTRKKGRTQREMHPLTERLIPKLLESLTEKNLISLEDWSGVRSGGERFLMLETIRQYALEQLRDLGEEGEVRLRHAHFYLQVASHGMHEYLGTRQVEAMMHLEAEQSNIRAALQYYAEAGQVLEQVTLASSMIWLWYLRGQFEEGEAWLVGSLAASQEAQARYEAEGITTYTDLAHARARALFGAGLLARERGDYAEAREAFEESAQLYSRIGKPSGVAYAKAFNALVAKDEGGYAEAKRLLDESLALATEAGDKWGQGLALSHMGQLAIEEGDFSLARELHSRALEAFRKTGTTGGARQRGYTGYSGNKGERWGMAQALTGLGNVAYYQRHFVQARALYEQSIELFREIGARVMLSWIYTSLGHTALMLGKYVEAVELYRQGLPTHREMSNLRSIAYTLNGLGEVARAHHDYAQAEEYYMQSYAIFREIEDNAGSAWSLHNQGVIAYQRGNVREGEALFKESLTFFGELANPRGVAAAISGMASMAALRGETQRASSLFAASETLLASADTTLDPVDEEEYKEIAEVARLKADKVVWQAGWEEGRAMAAGEGGLEKVISYAMNPPTSELSGERQPPKAKSASERQGGTETSASVLSKREIEVLRLLAEGLTNKEIAERLNLSHRTINAHLRTIFQKLAVTSRSAATRAAVDRKLV